MEDEHTRDEVREMATYGTSTTMLTFILFTQLHSFGSLVLHQKCASLRSVPAQWLTTFPLIYLEDAFDKRDTTGLIGLKEKVEAAHEQFKSEGGEASEANPNYFPGNVGGKHDVLVQLVGNQSILVSERSERALMKTEDENTSHY